MTANEKRFLERELEVLLKRLKRNRERVSADELKTIYRKGYESLLGDIQRKAQMYIKETVFTGMGGYYLQAEMPVMVQTLESIVNHPETGRQLGRALFKEPDMEQVRELAGKIRNQVEPVIREYQAHASKGE